MDLNGTKILYLIQLPPPVHGVSTINSIIYNSPLINSGIRKILLELKFSNELSELRKFNLSKIKRFFTLAGKLRKVLRNESPDFVYFSAILVGKGFWRDLLLVRIIKRSGSTPIYHLHNRGIGRNARRPLFRALYRYVFNNAMVIHLSDGLLEQEVKPLANETTRMFVVHNGIPNLIPDIPQNSKPEDKRPINLFFLSNLFEEKGIFDLLEIISAVREVRPDIKLSISGEFLRANFQNKLNNAIEKNNLKDTVILLDPVYGLDKARAFSESDVFVFPSYFRMECFPLVLLEAMSHGLPIVSTGIGAIPEIIDNGREGILLKERDIEGFVKAITQLSDNSDMREEMGLAARTKFQENYTSSHLENSVRIVFEECLKEVSAKVK